jgi:hypothetical protein
MKRITVGILAAALLAAAPAASAAPATGKNTSQAPICTGGSGDVTITATDKDISSYWFDGKRGSAIEAPLDAREIKSSQTFGKITVKQGVSTYTFDANCVRI